MNWKSLPLYVAIVLLGLLATAGLFFRNQNETVGAEAPLWTAVAAEQLFTPYNHNRWIIPQRYLTYALDLPQMSGLLAGAPLEFTPEGRANPLILSLPLPNGTLADFAIVESPIMEPELAAKFPDLKTYAGQRVDQPATTVRLDVTHHGFHAMIMSPDGTFFIDPYQRQDTRHYQVYDKQDYERETGFIELGTLEVPGQEAHVASQSTIPTGPELYVYRLAMAATGEYTIFHGGTVADGLAAIVTAVNRVNQMYERDVAVRLVLIANNDLIVYTNPATDPYTNNNGLLMLGENQANLDAVIGNANYDVGHVFSTGGGGVATLGVPCVTGFKARGVTGLPSPIGDPFWIDYVSHEIGHQFNARHTFNGNAGSCGAGGQWTGATAFEPGSGTTIMAYAGICGAQNIQPNSDAMFHIGSINEMVAYSRQGAGSQCAAIVNTGNNPPTADAGTGGFTIPRNTPFTLTGVGTDPDNDTLTYSWEQFDTGPSGHPNSPAGNAPLFRAFLPSDSPSRTFPQWSDIVNNTQTLGEILPSYTRSLSFRFTVRDNNVYPSAGGVDSALITFNVTANAGPFVVTAPNTAVTWPGYSTQTVSWDVANTDVTPVNCTAVDIFLSTDGGYNYPLTLLTAAPNNGSALVTVPPLNTDTARVKVKCATSIFFDISDTNFTIESVPSAVLAIEKTSEPASETAVAAGQPLTYTITVSNTGDLSATATITDTFSPLLADPVCNGVPGDLAVSLPLDVGETAVFVCTTTVASSLSLALVQTVDQEQVGPGTAVTFTVSLTNNTPLPLTQLQLDLPYSAYCTLTPDDFLPLPAGGSVSFTCPNVLIEETLDYTAVAETSLTLENVASAAAPEAAHQGEIFSDLLNHPLPLLETNAIRVTLVTTYDSYLPFIGRP